MAATEITLLDASGHPFALPKKLDVTPQSDATRTVNEWGSSNVREVSPAVIGRVKRMQLGQRMMVADKVYTDATYQAMIGDRGASVSGADWEVLPFTDRPGEKAKPEDKKVADGIAEMLYACDDFENLTDHLARGHRAYLWSGVETIFDESTMWPAGFRPVTNHALWSWHKETRSVRLLTDNDRRNGEPLKPGIWTTHSAAAQDPFSEKFDLGMMFTFSIVRYATADWATTSSKYGVPQPVAYYTDPNDYPKLVNAIARWGSEFAAVLPSTVKVELQRAIAATKDLQEGLARFAMEQAAKLGYGHVLVADAKSGTGTLANTGAQAVNLRVVRSIAKAVAASIRKGLIRVLAWIHYGPKVAARPPQLVFKVSPPADKKYLADTYEAWGRVFIQQGLAPEPTHLMEVSGIPDLVAIAVSGAAGAAPANPAADAEKKDAPAGAAPTTEIAADAGLKTKTVLTAAAISEIRATLKELVADLIIREAAIEILVGAGMESDTATSVVDQTLKAKSSLRVEAAEDNPAEPPAKDKKPDDTVKEAAAQRSQNLVAAALAVADDEPVVRTLDDVVAFSTLLGVRAAQDQVRGLSELVETARDEKWSLARLKEAVFERYDSFDITKLGEATAEGMVVSKAIGQGDVAARAGETEDDA